MKVNVKVASKVRSSEGRARNREGEGSMDSRNLTDAAGSLRRGGSDGTMTRTAVFGDYFRVAGRWIAGIPTGTPRSASLYSCK